MRHSALVCAAIALSATFTLRGNAEGEVVKGTPVKEIRKALRGLRSAGDACGIKLALKATPQVPTSYAAVMDASPFQLAFYADVGKEYAPPGATKTFEYDGKHIALPKPYTGLMMKKKPWGMYPATKTVEQYFTQFGELGEHAEKLPRAQVRTAELVLYTLDENGDGKVDLSDRDGEESKKTASKKDNTLLREIWGTKVEADKPTPFHSRTVVARGLRVPLDEKAIGKNRPLFTYKLSERFAEFDLNGDGDKTDELLFGDSDGNGKLDDKEIEKLLASARGVKPSLADNLGVDARFAAHGKGEDAVEALDVRLRQSRGIGGERMRRFIHNSVVRAELTFVIEYRDEKRNARVRRRMRGSADFRNAIMRLRGMTR